MDIRTGKRACPPESVTSTGGSHIIGLVQPGCGWGHGPVTRRPPGFTLDQGAPSSWVPAQTAQESWGHGSAWWDPDGTVLACLSSPHVQRQSSGACVPSRGSAGLDGTGQGTWWPRGAAPQGDPFPFLPDRAGSAGGLRGTPSLRLSWSPSVRPRPGSAVSSRWAKETPRAGWRLPAAT